MMLKSALQAIVFTNVYINSTVPHQLGVTTTAAPSAAAVTEIVTTNEERMRIDCARRNRMFCAANPVNNYLAACSDSLAGLVSEEIYAPFEYAASNVNKAYLLSHTEAIENAKFYRTGWHIASAEVFASVNGPSERKVNGKGEKLVKDTESENAEHYAYPVPRVNTPCPDACPGQGFKFVQFTPEHQGFSCQPCLNNDELFGREMARVFGAKLTISGSAAVTLKANVAVKALDDLNVNSMFSSELFRNVTCEKAHALIEVAAAAGYPSAPVLKLAYKHCALTFRSEVCQRNFPLEREKVAERVEYFDTWTGRFFIFVFCVCPALLSVYGMFLLLKVPDQWEDSLHNFQQSKGFEKSNINDLIRRDVALQKVKKIVVCGPMSAQALNEERRQRI